MQKTITEPARETPVMGEYDVVVCGGGSAGCAAAVSAARHGARTLLIEKDGFLGGLTTAAMVCVILSTNRVDFQGIWHEYIRAIRRRGGVGRHWLSADRSAFRGILYPEVVKYAWDDLLTAAGADILHHVFVAGALVEDNAIKGVMVETRGGRRAIRAQRVIDCTGHGIVCHLAGVEWEQGDGNAKWAMALTKVFRLANVKWEGVHFDAAALERIGAELDAAIGRGEFVTPTLLEKERFLKYTKGKLWDMGRGQVLSVLSRVLEVDPLDPWDFTRAEREGRAQAWEAAEAYRRFVPGCGEAYLLDTAPQVGVRSNRRVKGLARVTDDDAWNLRRQPDSIARSSWDIDIWPADSFSRPAVPREDEVYKQRENLVRAGGYFDIPYGCLVTEGVDNLLMAGQCISASHKAESSLRIQQTCMATGQAAGTAAALSLGANVSPRELQAETLIAQLDKDRDVEPAFDELKEINL